jgi:hypothetical protein
MVWISSINMVNRVFSFEPVLGGYHFFWYPPDSVLQKDYKRFQVFHLLILKNNYTLGQGINIFIKKIWSVLMMLVLVNLRTVSYHLMILTNGLLLFFK